MRGNKLLFIKKYPPQPSFNKGGSSAVQNHKYSSNAQSGHSPLLAGEMSTICPETSGDRGVKGIKKFHF
jgi:hypothetical protein